MGWRRDKTLPEDEYSDPTAYWASLRQGMRDKANHNKIEAQWCFAASIACTLVSPLFVTLAEGRFWAKVLPAILSVAATALTTWLQLRKPHRLWMLYRRAQRELEREKVRYDNALEPYGAADPKKLFAERMSSIAFWVHEQWEGLVPEPDMLASGAAHKRITRDDRTRLSPKNSGDSAQDTPR